MSDYGLILVPTMGKFNKDCCMVQVESRHVNKIPGEESEEIAFDTCLDPTLYDDHLSLAGALAKMIHDGRKYPCVRDGIITHLGELADILSDLKDTDIKMTKSSRLALFNYAIDRLRDIGKCIDFKM